MTTSPRLHDIHQVASPLYWPAQCASFWVSAQQRLVCFQCVSLCWVPLCQHGLVCRAGKSFTCNSGGIIWPHTCLVVVSDVVDCDTAFNGTLVICLFVQTVALSWPQQCQSQTHATNVSRYCGVIIKHLIELENYYCLFVCFLNCEIICMYIYLFSTDLIIRISPVWCHCFCDMFKMQWLRLMLWIPWMMMLGFTRTMKLRRKQFWRWMTTFWCWRPMSWSLATRSRLFYQRRASDSYSHYI